MNKQEVAIAIARECLKFDCGTLDCFKCPFYHRDIGCMLVQFGSNLESEVKQLLLDGDHHD